MVEKRLLVKDTRDGQVVVEVALESLLRQWRELAAWLRDEAQDLKAADTLERAAADWQASDRNESWLLEGTRLADAETLAAKPGFRDRLDPTRDFLQASRQREDDRIEAEKQRQQAELQAAQAARGGAAETLTNPHHRAGGHRHHRRSGRDSRCTGQPRAKAGRQHGSVRNGMRPALRLVSEAQSMLAGSRSGGDVRALQQLLAAHALRRSQPRAHSSTPPSPERNLLKIIETPEAASSVAFSPDGKRIVSGGATTPCGCGTRPPAKPIGQPLTGHMGLVYSVAFSPDGKRIVSGSSDKTVRLWDADTGQPVGQPLTGHTDTVFSVAFSPDGKRIVSGSADKTVRVWDATPAKPIGEPLTGHTSTVTSVAFSPDGKRIVSGSADNTVRLWDADTGQPIGQPLTGHTGTVFSVAFSPDGKRIVSGSGQDGAGVGRGHRPTDRRAPDRPHGHGVQRGIQPRRHTDRLRQRRQDGAAVGRGHRPTVGEPLTGHTDPVLSVAFSPDGKRIVSGS